MVLIGKCALLCVCVCFKLAPEWALHIAGDGCSVALGTYLVRNEVRNLAGSERGTREQTDFVAAKRPRPTTCTAIVFASLNTHTRSRVDSSVVLFSVFPRLI